MTLFIQIILFIIFNIFSVRAVLIAKGRQPSKKITANLVAQTNIMFLLSLSLFFNPIYVSIFLYCLVLCLIVVFKKNFELNKIWIMLLLLPTFLITIWLGYFIIFIVNEW